MEPADLFIGAEPGELPLGKMTCVTLHKGDCFIERDPAPEIKPDLAVADALKRRKIQAVSPLHQAVHLIDQPPADHLIAAPVDQSVQLFALAIEPYLQNLERALFKAVLLLPAAYPLPCQFEDLQCTDNPVPVVGVDPIGSIGIDLSQALVEKIRAPFPRFLL